MHCCIVDTGGMMRRNGDWKLARIVTGGLLIECGMWVVQSNLSLQDWPACCNVDVISIYKTPLILAQRRSDRNVRAFNLGYSSNVMCHGVCNLHSRWRLNGLPTMSWKPCWWSLWASGQGTPQNTTSSNSVRAAATWWMTRQTVCLLSRSSSPTEYMKLPTAKGDADYQRDSQCTIPKDVGS